MGLRRVPAEPRRACARRKRWHAASATGAGSAGVFGRIAYNLGSIGDLGRAIEKAEQALRDRARGRRRPRARCASNVVLARALYARGDYRRAMEAVREQRRARRAEPTPPAGVRSCAATSSFSRIWGVLALAELGEFAEAIARGDEALRVSAAEFGRHARGLGPSRRRSALSREGRLSRGRSRCSSAALPLCEVGR